MKRIQNSNLKLRELQFLLRSMKREICKDIEDRGGVPSEKKINNFVQESLMPDGSKFQNKSEHAIKQLAFVHNMRRKLKTDKAFATYADIAFCLKRSTVEKYKQRAKAAENQDDDTNTYDSVKKGSKKHEQLQSVQLVGFYDAEYGENSKRVSIKGKSNEEYFLKKNLDNIDLEDINEVKEYIKLAREGDLSEKNFGVRETTDEAMKQLHFLADGEIEQMNQERWKKQNILQLNTADEAGEENEDTKKANEYVHIERIYNSEQAK